MQHCGESVHQLINRQGGYVARLAVGKLRPHAQLHLAFRFDQYFLARGHLNGLELRRGFQIVRHPLRKPSAQQFVILGLFAKAQSAFMRNFRRGLEQDQTFLGCDRIDPPRRKVARQAEVIEVRVLAAQ